MPPPASEPQVEIVADERVARVDRGDAPPPDDWTSRSLYIGEAGGRNWLEVVHEPGYPLRDPDVFGLRANRLSTIANRPVATVVSLGAGDGEHDRDVVRVVRPVSPGGRVRYVPVDLSLPLLRAAAEKLRADVDVPAAILADFEGGREFLTAALRAYAPRPVLLALLGGTVGNLDKGLPAFFDWALSALEPRDAFLLDVPLAGPGWSAGDEPRLRTGAYSAAFRRFLAGGMDSGDPDRAAADFDHRAGLTLGHDYEIDAEVVTVTDRATGHTVLTFRRFRWEPLLSWFRGRGFGVAATWSSLGPGRDRFGMGVILLTCGGEK